MAACDNSINVTINALKEEINKLELRKEYDKLTSNVRILYESFIGQGFDESEAFALTDSIIKNMCK
jgi:hypothetical protein